MIVRAQEQTSVLLAIMIAIAAVGAFMFVVVMQHLQTLQVEVAASGGSPVDVSGWQTYQNTQYGFELEYPPQWTIYAGGLAGSDPFIEFGNPLDGMKTYTLQIFIEQNPGALSSGEYAHAVLAADRAADAANAKNGPAPLLTPRFDRAYALTAGQYAAYELDNVFEFDHNAERIDAAHGDEALRFDFPVAEENPNLSLPVANNEVAHDIVNTLVFTP